MENSASTIALSLALPMTEKSARSPKIRFNAANKIDFPEPVSPVITVKPLLKFNSAVSINAKFWMRSVCNISL